MRRIASILRRSHNPDRRDLTAAARRLVQREGMTPHDIFHVGAADGALTAAYQEIGFGTVAFGALGSEPHRGSDRVTLVMASLDAGTQRRLSAFLASADDLQAVILPPLDAKNLAHSDRILFDRGLVRLAPCPGEQATIYLRSSCIERVGETGGNPRATVAMSNFGHNAGFANQLFQYAFLRLYGLRNNCAVETPAWIGQTIYDIPAHPITRKRRRYKGDEWSIRDLSLWTAESPPVEVDFWGYFQNPPASWRPHRQFLRRLFTALPPWRDPIERWLRTYRPAGATLVAIHIRRGDYRQYGAAKPWFLLIPEEWYRQWLARIGRLYTIPCSSSPPTNAPRLFQCLATTHRSSPTRSRPPCPSRIISPISRSWRGPTYSPSATAASRGWRRCWRSRRSAVSSPRPLPRASSLTIPGRPTISGGASGHPRKSHGGVRFCRDGCASAPPGEVPLIRRCFAGNRR